MKMVAFKFLIFSLSVASVVGSPKRLFGDPSHAKDPAESDAGKMNMDDYSEEELFAELNEVIGNLNEDQLQSLVDILEKEEFDEMGEFDMISSELKDIGMDDEDIKDLKLLTGHMHDFLMGVEGLVKKLELESTDDLRDNIQLYLLGLPNKLGPLGYIALHKVLEDEVDDTDDGADADDAEEDAAAAAVTVTEPKPMTFRRRRESDANHHGSHHHAPAHATGHQGHAPAHSMGHRVQAPAHSTMVHVQAPAHATGYQAPAHATGYQAPAHATGYQA